MGGLQPRAASSLREHRLFLKHAGATFSIQAANSFGSTFNFVLPVRFEQTRPQHCVAALEVL